MFVYGRYLAGIWPAYVRYLAGCSLIDGVYLFEKKWLQSAIKHEPMFVGQPTYVREAMNIGA